MHIILYLGICLEYHPEDIDKNFRRNFNKWVAEWLYTHKKVDFRKDYLTWYHMFEKVAPNEKEALELFYSVSEEFFEEYHKSKE